MRQYPFKLVNVFAESHFGGNPLAVFPNAEGLSDLEMQQIAQQFNLSETVFAFPSTTATADLRIFTPVYEMPLAGHPTLGCAYILQQQHNLPETFVLNTPAKPVQIQASSDLVQMAIQGFQQRECSATQAEFAEMLGVNMAQIAEKAVWINSGSEQLLLQVFDKQAISNAQPNAAQLATLCEKDNGTVQIYIWFNEGNNIHSRLFWGDAKTLLEDSGTGSAAANLGAYFISQNQFPIACQILQGDYMHRPNRIRLQVDENQTIFVGGKVLEVGEGIFKLP